MKAGIQRIFLLVLFFMGMPAHGLTILPDGPAQAPVIYVHGYIDDGTAWARDSLNKIEKNKPLSYAYLQYYVFGPERSPSTFFTNNGIKNWAVQWWANDGFNTFSTADEGYAFLQNAEQLLAGTDWINGTWSVQNRPRPSALDVLFSSEIDTALDASSISSAIPPISRTVLNTALKASIASQLWIRSTYQDAGRVDPRAEDLLDLLRTERRDGGKLSRYRQVNIITHSMGSLVARAMLDKAAKASLADSEFVANVIYNAPPFAGSSMAYLSKIYFEPEQITSTIFEDGRLQIMLSSIESRLGVAAIKTAKDLLIYYIDFLLLPYGVSYADLEAGFNLPTQALTDILLLIPINESLSPQFLNALSGTPTGEAIAAAIQAVRPFVAGLMGMKGAPGHDDLTPEGGLAHITNYSNSPDVKQFVTLGTGGVGVHLFPDDLDAVANNPSLIINNSVLNTQVDDTAVAVGSAKLLTTTDNFGPRMQLLGEFDQKHTEMLYSGLSVMGPVWMETLLSPSTRMQVTGDAQVVNSAERSYLIRDANASFVLESDPIQRTITLPGLAQIPIAQTADINVFAQAYEYRLTSDDGTTVINDWTQLAPGESLTFSGLVTEHNLQEQPFYIEWRSINQRGGREMIRSARFVVAGEAPQLVDANILSPDPAQVLKSQRRSLIGGRAVRSTGFTRILNADEILQLSGLTSQAEANWVVSQPQNKALTMSFDRSGGLIYEWDDSQLQNAETLTDVSAHLVPLAGLDEGLHTLYFRSFNPLTPDQLSPLQQIRVQVDNTAPRLNFALQENHPLGVVIGPMTPLHFSIEDVGSNGATGELTVAGNSEWVFPAGETFSLQQTELKQQLEAVGIVGGEVDLSIAGRDAVGNTRTESFRVYYDIAAPEVSVNTLTPVIEVAADEYQLFTATVDLVIDVSDAGSGLAEAAPVMVIAGEEGGYQLSEALTLGGVSGFPDKYGATISLPMGSSKVMIAASDFAGNTGVKEFTIERIDPVVQDVALDIVSPRIDSNVCFNAAGDAITCTLGSIDQFTSSYDGEVVAFTSSGTQFVRSDSNRSKDIFIWAGQDLRIASRNALGELANDDSQRPALSGNGRYVFFESAATNLVADTQGFNLYVKDLDTGKIAVVSRAPDGSPINISLTGNFNASTTFSGRYVFFSSRNATYLDAFPANPGTQVYMVDLDPDGDGDYFNDNYVTHAVSNISATAMPDNTSELPKVTQDGRYVVFNSRSDGALRLIRFAGSDAGGDLDTTQRAETIIAGSGGTVFAISPNGDDVAFVTRSNLLPADDNRDAIDADVYLSRGEVSGASFSSRSLTFVSAAANGAGSAMDAAFPLQDVSVSVDRLGSNNALKVAWVSSHTDIVSGDANNVEDMFVSRETSVFPAGLAVPNWISDMLPSNSQVRTAALSPDGRYAFWVNQQSYAAPFASNDRLHLYRRRIDPPQSTSLTVQVQGNGTVSLSPSGNDISAGVYQFANEEKVQLTALAEEGFELSQWQGDVAGTDIGNSVRMTQDRVATAVFSAIPGPTFASAQITVPQGQESEGVLPDITAQGSEVFSISIVSQPSNGRASSRGGRLYYQSVNGFEGQDSFEFQVTNDRGVSLPVPAIATVQVNVLNRAPESAELIISTEVNQASSPLEPSVQDPDAADTFSFEIISPAAHGQVSRQGNAFIYQPDTDFEGEDSFNFSVTDSAEHTIIASAQVRVTAVTAETGTGTDTATDTANENTGGGGGSLGIVFYLMLLLLTLRARKCRLGQR